MSYKVFISYSHTDEKYKEQLEKHLAALKRNGIISIWHDRKILPGTNWEKEISENLINSEIILFLISPDFISSDYCYNIEMQTAINQYNLKKSIIVPIIIRPCDWQEIEIGHIQALPKNGKPIDLWENKDEAWLNVIQQLKKLIKEFFINIKNGLVPITETKLSLNPEFIEYLEDTKIKFQHRNKEKIVLSDIFVYPDLRELEKNLDLVEKIISSEQLDISNLICIIGDEQSGKTSLCKKIYSDYFKKDYYPVLLNGKSINTSDHLKIIINSINKQYNNVDPNILLNSDKLILIIDDFDKTKLNRKYQERFIKNLTSNFKKLLILVSSTFRIELYEIDYLKEFQFFELLYFGNKKRYELIEKWHSLGQEETIDDIQLQKQTDLTKIHVDSFVKKNIVPSRPVFILSILQLLESYDPSNLKLTSYGYCYEYLIISLLKKINLNVKEIGKYVNYLTELAYFKFSNDIIYLDEDKLTYFNNIYSSKYIKPDYDVLINNLKNCGILRDSSEGLYFNYKYIYYFYIAKYISDYFYQNDEVKDFLQKLVENLHVEEYANILIFVTHHTKDPYILDKIQNKMMSIFENEEEASLDKNELQFLQDFILDIPKLIIKQKNIRLERLKRQERLDLLDNNHDDSRNEDISILKDLHSTFKSIEIVGQIIRNRHSSLEKQKLAEITDNAYGVGLRFLKFFMEISDRFKSDIVEYIKDIINENPNLADEEIEKEARKTFLFLTYGVIYSIIRKISISVGSSEALVIYNEMIKKRKTPASYLIYSSIILFFTNNLDLKELEKIYNSLEDNLVAKRIFKEFVVQHLYLYDVSIKVKQQISNIFQIPIKSQRLITGKKETKL